MNTREWMLYYDRQEIQILKDQVQRDLKVSAKFCFTDLPTNVERVTWEVRVEERWAQDDWRYRGAPTGRPWPKDLRPPFHFPKATK